jgi:hypothetical protein
MAEQDFLARLESLGAVPLYEAWQGVMHPHHIQCNAGHDAYPTPNNVQRGQGICRYCVSKIWDTFYVVRHDTHPWVKFGITSGDPKPRLGDHRRTGYSIILGLFTDLPGTIAPDLERELIRALKYEGYYCLRGREYYELEALPRIVEVVNSRIPEKD